MEIEGSSPIGSETVYNPETGEYVTTSYEEPLTEEIEVGTVSTSPVEISLPAISTVSAPMEAEVGTFQIGALSAPQGFEGEEVGVEQLVGTAREIGLAEPVGVGGKVGFEVSVGTTKGTKVPTTTKTPTVLAEAMPGLATVADLENVLTAYGVCRTEEEVVALTGIGADVVKKCVRILQDVGAISRSGNVYCGSDAVSKLISQLRSVCEVCK